MKQSNAPKNTKENMSESVLFNNAYEGENILVVSKFPDETFYSWFEEFSLWSDLSVHDIGCWRLTKKRENKTSEWQKVLDSKITREQLLERFERGITKQAYKFKSDDFETLSEEHELYKTNLN